MSSTNDSEDKIPDENPLLATDKKSNAKGKLTGPLIFATFAAAFGCNFPFGYNIGVLNVPEEIVRQWIQEVQYGINNVSLLNDTQLAEEIDQSLTGWISFINTLFPIGCIFGSLVAGAIGEHFGRQKGLLANNSLALTAAMLMSISKLAQSIWPLVIGRFISGINVGVSSCLCPMYLSEIAPTNYRGLLGAVNNFTLVLAILVSQIFGLPQLLGTEQLWPLLFAMLAIPAVVQLICLPFCPESPTFLLVVRGDYEAAKSALNKLRLDHVYVAEEMKHLVKQQEKLAKIPKISWAQLLQGPQRWFLFLAVMVMLAQQLSGINVVSFYSTSIFISAGLTGNQPKYATLGVGVVSLIATGISAGLIELAGRRTLLLCSLAGVFVSTIGLVAFLHIPVVAVVSLLVFVGTFALGTGGIPWLFATELFTQEAQSKAASCACVANWLSAVLVTFSFKYVQSALEDLSFLPFLAFQLFFLIFLWKFMPETKNRTVMQIQHDHENKRRKPLLLPTA